jgi:hypothetical protein
MVKTERISGVEGFSLLYSSPYPVSSAFLVTMEAETNSDSL